jgi:hypothetical protein
MKSLSKLSNNIADIKENLYKQVAIPYPWAIIPNMLKTEFLPRYTPKTSRFPSNTTCFL